MCYGSDVSDSNKNRKNIWMRRTEGAKLSSKPPELRSLPPTDASLELNILRARFQRMIWGSSLEAHPPKLDPCEYGWGKDEETRTLYPLMVPKGTKIAPDEVLKSTKCNCQASQCRTLACSCMKANMACSEFWGCQEQGCLNKWNNEYDEEDEEHDDSENELNSDEECTGDDEE